MIVTRGLEEEVGELVFDGGSFSLGRKSAGAGCW